MEQQRGWGAQRDTRRGLGEEAAPQRIGALHWFDSSVISLACPGSIAEWIPRFLGAGGGTNPQVLGPVKC